MDTKSKNTNLTRGLFSWSCYLLVFFTLIVVAVYSVLIFAGYGSDIFTKAERIVYESHQVLRGELRTLDTYKENASAFFERLYYNSQTTESAAQKAREQANTLNSGTPYLDSISRDNLYCVVERSADPNGVLITNDSNWIPGTLPDGFNYLFISVNRHVMIYHEQPDGKLSCVFNSEDPGSFYTSTLAYTIDALKTEPVAPEIYFAVRTEPTSYYAANEIVGSAQNDANRLLFQICLVAAVVILFLLMLCISIIFRRDRLFFTERLAILMKHIWIELKILLTAILFFSAYVLIFGTGSAFLAVCGFYLIFIYIHLLLIDLFHNRRIWKHNIIHSILRFISHTRQNRRFEQIEYRKFLAMVIVLLGLGIIAILVTLITLNAGSLWRLSLFFYAAIAVAVAGTLFWFGATVKEDLHDYGVLMDQIDKMYSGDLNAVNHIPSSSPLYSYAMQLNMIRDGIRIAVEDGVKSERTKVELITNVSHDIKTPLTSIISYIELLKSEELPPHVADYVSVISQKADRLRSMIQDIFDVSKATTGNIALEPEYLDLKTLLRQTLADMDELIESSPLQWRIQIPEENYPVFVDGQRMYRVFQNLIKNAAQYALEGSRVYVVLVKQAEHALLSIRNISKHELDVSGEELTARFVRGDKSRTSSGSGLGLSIAKSFTEACGGTFRILVNGDQFSAEITLPLKEQSISNTETTADENTDTTEN